MLQTESVSMVDAAFRTEIDVYPVDGTLTLKIPTGTQPGTDFRIRGEGVPHMRGKGRGDHIVQLKIEVPKKLSKKQKKLLQEFQTKAGKLF